MTYPSASLVALLLTSPLAFATGSVSLQGSLATDLPVRGIALSNGEPMIAATAEWDHRSGWFAGATGFSAEEGPVPDRSRGWRAHVGHFREFADNRALEASIAHTEFSGNFPSSWDYTEARVDLHLSRELSVSGAYSPDLQGRDVTSLAFAATWRPPLGERSYALISTGTTRLGDSEDDWINFAEIGAGLHLGRLHIRLQHHLVDNKTVRVFHVDGRNATTLRIDYQLW